MLVVVDDVGDVVDEPDDEFGHRIPGRCLACDDDGARHNVGMHAGANAVVQGDDMQHVEQLPFVFVDAFDLDVEHRGRIDFDAELLAYQSCKTFLVRLFDRAKLLLEFRFVGIVSQLSATDRDRSTKPLPIRSVISLANPGLA